mmetsp:Transcript_18717/g.21513  ORF Transcript_18717/g.21513 Transcript_18717/m.21513 type:complete len:80 (-) Transcript_18717:38-277(-)
MDAKANARAAAIRRTGTGGQVKKVSGKGNDSFAFLSGTSQGFEVSPKAVLIISLVFIGVVVLLHIFGKVKSAATAAPAE